MSSCLWCSSKGLCKGCCPCKKKKLAGIKTIYARVGNDKSSFCLISNGILEFFIIIQSGITDPYLWVKWHLDAIFILENNLFWFERQSDRNREFSSTVSLHKYQSLASTKSSELYLCHHVGSRDPTAWVISTVVALATKWCQELQPGSKTHCSVPEYDSPDNLIARLNPYPSFYIFLYIFIYFSHPK